MAKRAVSVLVSVLVVSALVSVLLVSVCYAEQRLDSQWQCVDFSCAVTPDPSGDVLRVSRRTLNSQAPAHPFSITPLHMFSVSADIRVLNDVTGQLGQTVDLVIRYRSSGGGYFSETVARHPLARADQGWIRLQGNFKVRGKAQSVATLRVIVPDRRVTFEVRGARVSNLWYGQGWRSGVDDVIANHRQFPLLLNITAASNVDPRQVQIQIVQKSKAFPIGTAVNVWNYEAEGNSDYRHFIHRHFTWAVLEASLKWSHVESSQGHENFWRPLRVLTSLREQGLKTRGHTLVWSVDYNVPGWVKELKGEALRSAVTAHINTTMTTTRGLLDHWDVLNENLHGQWFQRQLGDVSWEQEPFMSARSLDPRPQLFLNDFDVVAHGMYTGAYIEQARRLQRAGVALDGLGVQCHFWKEERPDPYLIKDRLDKLSQTGLPIWVTELNVWSANEQRRADFLETAMRALYGHPAVKGILLWGFWDRSHSRGPNAALATGNPIKVNAAGQRFLELWEGEWMTNVSHVLSDATSAITVRAFQGQHQLRVQYQGRELSHVQRDITVGESAQTVNVHIQV